MENNISDGTKYNKSVNTEEIIGVVDEALQHHLIRSGEWDSVTKKITGTIANMESEKLTLCEMNIQLWDDALMTAIRDISISSYPHLSAMQAIINYVLNDYGETSFGTISEILNRLLKYHPPVATMVPYYMNILQGHYAQITKNGPEIEDFFWFLLDLIRKHRNQPTNSMCWEMEKDSAADVVEASLAGGIVSDAILDELISKKFVRYYDQLLPEQQILRSTTCLQFVCDILEINFSYWLKNSRGDRKFPRSLLATLIWPDAGLNGQLTPNVQRIIEFYFLGEPTSSAMDLYCKMLAMVAQLVIDVDQIQNKEYPFFGSHSADLARAIALRLLEGMKKANDETVIKFLRMINPPWLRMLCCCHVLENLVGFHCLPELESVVTILDHILRLTTGRQGEPCPGDASVFPADPKLIARFKKLKSVNRKDSSGFNCLHIACRQNKPEVVRALLTFPELDVNQTSGKGWTALHEAASLGSVSCVKELLAHSPRLGAIQRPTDTRALGPDQWTPLMVAAEAGHAEICSLLLQHSGSVLLEDVTVNNETALTVCVDKEAKKILNHFQTNYIETAHSRSRLHLITDNLPFLVLLSSVMVHGYLATHLTWDIYHRLKTKTKTTQTPLENREVLFQYSRYHRDFKTYLPRLRRIAGKLSKVPQLAHSTENMIYMLFLNKVN